MIVRKILFNILYRIKYIYLRPMFEYFGIDNFSRPEYGRIRLVIDLFLNFNNGFFIEAGGGDGIIFSNTYYLEKFRGWKGILIEPVPVYAKQLRRNRPDAIVYECALVNKSYVKPNIELTSMGFSTYTKGSLSLDEENKNKALIRQLSPHIRSRVFSASVRTLSSIINEVKPKKIDLLSLDVEGFESEVLKGLDLKRWRPTYLLFEAQNSRKLGQVLQVINKYYKNSIRVSDIDYLYW